jgi:MFS family permease
MSLSDDVPSTAKADANARRLLWAGFMAILASGVGFSIRTGILGQWADRFGFTQTELGGITGGGLTGFGIVILLSSLIADKFGYGKLMVTAFLVHLASLVLTLAAGPAYASGGKDAAYQCLFWGMFLFAVGNGIAEAVVNPLVATLFPSQKTHYLNLLHAGWPGGLIAGGLLSYLFNSRSMFGTPVRWEIQFGLVLIPVVLYGLMMVGRHFPRSEASQQGVSYVNMLGELGMLGAAVICVLLGLFFYSDLGNLFETYLGSRYVGLGLAAALWLGFSYVIGFRAGPVVLAVLLIAHALVGYVELGTDSWIAKITGAIMASPQNGRILFVYTSALMFALRFFAGPIVERLSPLGLLCVSGILGAIGLTLLSNAQAAWFCVLAATVYALGKTFLWPTMLAVASEQFPRGGAITIGAMGGVGMLSAGLLGGPGIGFKQDYYASQSLRKHPEVFERYRAPNENQFLAFKTVGLDGTKVGILEDPGEGGVKTVERDLERLKSDPNAQPSAVENQQKLYDWWQSARTTAATDGPLVTEATLFGSRMALKLTAFVPAAMAVIYLLLILYYKARGGYRQVHLDGLTTEKLAGMPTEVIEA